MISGRSGRSAARRRGYHPRTPQRHVGHMLPALDLFRGSPSTSQGAVGMNQMVKCWLLAAVLLTCSAAVGAAPSTPGKTTQKTWDHLVDEVVARYDLPGIVVGVI